MILTTEGIILKNADMPAMPCEWKDFDSQGVQVVRESYDGLTKREMFAMHAMHGLSTGGSEDWLTVHAPAIAVKIADALLAELEKTK